MILLLGFCDLSYPSVFSSVIIHNYCNSDCQNKINLNSGIRVRTIPTSHISVALTEIFSLKTRQTVGYKNATNSPLMILGPTILCFSLLNLDKQMPAGADLDLCEILLSSSELLPQNYPHLTTLYKAGGFYVSPSICNSLNTLL